ncbi:Eco29kI family restriction endonuclease [Janthinobacterium sp. PAMC25594]|uniref:Eco29kI family restriction endonuclease n=1 Tax=Janthinobacterium sp. PAMC25594 TaxID=2861284 RepID=UPI001C6289CC|nr:Eco29kI family restriction endonuclease [Janthinobacterium sp. PAMC25594]QYG06152.1 Eco29kI family restriction endonuclease [Janthinobacterium sp. PAMC25594]
MATSKKVVPPLETMLAELQDLASRIANVDAGTDARSVKKIRLELEKAVSEIKATTERLDPVWRPESIFDPSDPNTAGRVVALTMVAQERHSLAAIPEFYGAGVYAIYYGGDFLPYLPLKDKDHPIYVGKADPDRQGAKDAVTQGTKLSARLNEHARSIRKATTTLKIEDFECRFLIVQSGYQKSAEDYLINFFKPIWNSETKICFGLGKHGDSSDTRVNKRSPWDTLHPGREWADRTFENQKSPEVINEQIAGHFAIHMPYTDVHQIFERIMADMRQINRERFFTPTKDGVLFDQVAAEVTSPPGK